jgi:hypothetical protein
MMRLVDTFYYFLIVVLSVGLIIAIWVARRSGHDVSMNLGVPVRFELDPATHAFVTARHDVQAVSITQAHGTLQFTAWASSILDVAWPGLVFAIVILGVVLFVLNRLRSIFRSLTDQNPFVAANASRIRMIGIVLVLGQLARAGPLAWFAGRVTREISVTGLRLKGDMSINT